MASIIKKKVKKHTYYYLVESARVNGKPRIVNQKYLGTANDIATAVDLKTDSIPDPEYSTVLDFGAVCALFDIAERIGVRNVINAHAGKRPQGLAMTLCSVLNRELEDMGYKMSINSMINCLMEVQQVITVFSQSGKKQVSKSSLSRLDGMAKTIIENLGLLKYQIKL